MTAGLTSTGFVANTLYAIRNDVEQQILTLISPYANLLPESVLAKLTGIFSQGMQNCWDAVEGVHNAHSIAAEGQMLDIMATIAGKQRKAATKAFIEAGFTTTGACTIPAGTRFTITGTDFIFESAEEIYVSTATLTNIKIYAATEGLLDLPDTGSFEFSPITNLSAVGYNISVNDIYYGTNTESDASLRNRMQTQSSAKSYVGNAIYNQIMALNDASSTNGTIPIESCTIIENVSEAYDVDGRPPHSIEVVAYYAGLDDDNTDAAIATAIALSKADGIPTVSTEATSVSAEVTLSDNVVRSITWTKPAEIGIDMLLTTTPVLSADQKDALNIDIMSWCNALLPGEDVILYGKNSLSEVLNNFADADITSYSFLVNSGTSNIIIGYTEIARIQDVTDISYTA